MRAVLGWSRDLVAAYSGVDDSDPVAIAGAQAPRQDIRPAVLPVHGRGRAVRDRIAKRDDRKRILRRYHLQRIQEEPRRCAVGKRLLVLRFAERPAPGRADVGGRHGLGMPCHWPALARNMKADGKLVTSKLDVRGIPHEIEDDAVAPHRSTRRHCDRVFSAKRDRAVCAFRKPGPSELQTDMNTVKGDRLGAEHIAETDTHLLPPDAGAHDQAHGLISGACCRIRKRKTLVRLRRDIADGVWPLRGGDPADDPLLACL